MMMVKLITIITNVMMLRKIMTKRNSNDNYSYNDYDDDDETDDGDDELKRWSAGAANKITALETGNVEKQCDYI